MDKLQVGDRVVYAAKFLRSVAWYTGVPIDGMIRAIDGIFVDVEWSDGHRAPVHASNIIRADRKHLEPR